MVKISVAPDEEMTSLLPAIAGAPPVTARVLPGFSAYDETLQAMEAQAAKISADGGGEALWFLEHPALYTAGTSAQREDLIDAARLPVFETGRGGEYTYHGPGQRVVYVMLDLRTRRQDVRAFVRALEGWIIDALAEFGVLGERRDGRVGIWVRRPDKGPAVEDKIAAIGLRVRKWVTFHGISINVSPDLSHYQGIVPCGISEHGVTSLQDLEVDCSMADLDEALLGAFPKWYGDVTLEG